MALLPLDMTLGLAVYTSMLLHPFRMTAGVRIIRERRAGERQHLVRNVLLPLCPSPEVARLRAHILGWVTSHPFLC